MLYSDSGMPRHVGVVVGWEAILGEQRTMVISKWGTHGLYHHPIDVVPLGYGTEHTFWRLDPNHMVGR